MEDLPLLRTRDTISDLDLDIGEEAFLFFRAEKENFDSEVSSIIKQQR